MELSQNAASSAGVSKVRNESFALVVEGGAEGAVDGAPLEPVLGGAATVLGDDVEQPVRARTAAAATANIPRRRDPGCSTSSSSDDGDRGRRTVTRLLPSLSGSTLTSARPGYLIQTVDVFGKVAT